MKFFLIIFMLILNIVNFLRLIIAFNMKILNNNINIKNKYYKKLISDKEQL